MKNTRHVLTTAVAGAALGAAALFAPAASAGSNVAWSLSVGGPGFGVNVGQPAYGGYFGAPYRPYVRPVVIAPPVYYRPPPVVYRPVVFAPRPVYYAPARVVYGPHGYPPRRNDGYNAGYRGSYNGGLIGGYNGGYNTYSGFGGYDH